MLALNSRYLTLILFFVVVLVVSFGQLAYISPKQALAAIQNESELELVQLRLENSGLREKEQHYTQVKKEHEEEINQMKEEMKKKEAEKEQADAQITEIKLQKEDLEKKITQLQQSTTETQPTQSTQATQSQTIDQKMLEMVNAQQNVITNKDTLVYLVNNFNDFGAVRNADKFTLEKDFIPIVIRVFNKHEYFGYALENYRKVKGIDKTMIIVSHDGVFPEMFKLVQSIDFCQVKQIVHPYSGHLLMNRFPGPDKTLSDNRDQYGNPRPFPHTALKHHYWWHLNYVWDQFLANHTGDMVFMEEDHVPTTDYYQTVKALAKIREERCPDCFNSKIHQHQHAKAGHHDLILTHDLGNVGMTWDRKRWVQLRAASKEFCTFDDYNWDWSMSYLTALGKIAPLSLTAAFPRAEHMGKCGQHAHAGSCEISEEDRHHFEEVNEPLKADGGNWEKYNYNANPVDGQKGVGKGWGGWAHPRDHQHCMDMVKKGT